MNIDEALKVCYELEGLLSLAADRRDDTPAMVEVLIAEKIKQLGSIAGNCDAGSTVAVDVEDVCDDAEIPEDIAVPEEVVTVESTEVVVDDPVSMEPKETIEPKESKVTPDRATLLRRSFTVNDKFRFRRELFGNSETEFADALNLVSAMNCLSEAEDYFYGDLEWDSENEEVRDFMDVISRFFESTSDLRADER